MRAAPGPSLAAVAVTSGPVASGRERGWASVSSNKALTELNLGERMFDSIRSLATFEQTQRETEGMWCRCERRGDLKTGQASFLGLTAQEPEGRLWTPCRSSRWTRTGGKYGDRGVPGRLASQLPYGVQRPLYTTTDPHELPKARWRQVRQGLHHRGQHVRLPDPRRRYR
jgi:hypothetical protein